MGELMFFIIGAVLVAGITFFVTYFLLDRRADSRVKKAQLKQIAYLKRPNQAARSNTGCQG